jgi:hypothetical protein
VLYSPRAQASCLRPRREIREDERGLAGWELTIWLFVAVAAIGLVLTLLS